MGSYDVEEYRPGRSLYGARIANNYYEAIKRYKDAIAQAKQSMAQLLKADAERQTMTPYPVIPDSPYLGNQKLNMPPIKGKEEINEENKKAKAAQQTAKDIATKTSIEANPNFVGPPNPNIPQPPSQAEQMEITDIPKEQTPIPSNQIKTRTPYNYNNVGPNNYSVVGYDTGIGGGDKSTVNKDISEYFSKQAQGYAQTQSGLADFIRRLAEIEAKQGSVMDLTGMLAGQNPNDVRKEVIGTTPISQLESDVYKMPENIYKRLEEYRKEAAGLGSEFDIRRAREYLGKLIEKYPTAHAALQNGILTIAPDGSLQYDYGKMAKLGEDERNNIARFLGEMGALGINVYKLENKAGGLGAITNYLVKESPELLNKLVPRSGSERDRTLKETYLIMKDQQGNMVTVGRTKVHPDNSTLVSVDERDPDRLIKIYEWSYNNPSTGEYYRLYPDQNTGLFVWEYKDKYGNPHKTTLGTSDLYNTIKKFKLKPYLYHVGDQEAFMDLSKFGWMDKQLYATLKNYTYAASNNNPDLLGKYTFDSKPAGEFQYQQQTQTSKYDPNTNSYIQENAYLNKNR